MKKLLALLLLINFNTFASDTDSYELFNNELSINLPSELKKLSNSSINKRYGKQSIPPAYAFSNRDNNVSFSFTQYQTPAQRNNMNKIHKAISNMLRQAHSQSTWKKDKVYTRLGTKIAVYEYETKAVGKYQYNITYALPIEGKLTFLSFTTTDTKYKKKWVALARESFDSITLTTEKNKS